MLSHFANIFFFNQFYEKVKKSVIIINLDRCKVKICLQITFSVYLKNVKKLCFINQKDKSSAKKTIKNIGFHVFVKLVHNIE